MQKKILFIHGFGVKKDARGIFTDIENSLKEDNNFADYKCVFTDLNIVNDTNDITLNPLSVQAEILNKVYEQEKDDSEITVIAHSQGCLVSSIAGFPKLSKVILLCPPTNNDLEKTIKTFSERSGTIINLEGLSYLMRKDGSRTIVPKEYWEHRKMLNYLEEYKKFSNTNRPTIILAKQDEVVSNENKVFLSEIGDLVEIDGNHNFEGDSRTGLIKLIKNNL